jgi:hypothetical protein
MVPSALYLILYTRFESISCLFRGKCSRVQAWLLSNALISF